MICHDKNDDYNHKGKEGEGQRVMIEVIISENDDNIQIKIALSMGKVRILIKILAESHIAFIQTDQGFLCAIECRCYRVIEGQYGFRTK